MFDLYSNRHNARNVIVVVCDSCRKLHIKPHTPHCPNSRPKPNISSAQYFSHSIFQL